MDKVVTAREMARIEALAIEQGCCQEAFMRQAGACVAEVAQNWMKRRSRVKDVSLLIWKGNKSGDAFVVGIQLLSAGYRVCAYLLLPLKQCSFLCQQFANDFCQRGGILVNVKNVEDLAFGSEGLIVDGLLGTGFSGVVEGLLKSTIETANRSGVPILAIDIPSGLNGSTGEIGGVAIQASLTVTLGLPKIGFFLQNGWNIVGELYIGTFGLPTKFLEQAEPIAYLPTQLELKQFLPKIIRNRHKYQAGCVIGYAGSAHASGAAKLAALAALRGGAGIVKLFYPESAQTAMNSMPYEIVHCPWEEGAWSEALKHARSVLIGPGIGRDPSTREWLKRVVPTLSLPTVLDADALQSDLSFPAISICTPHRGEMLRLLGVEQLEEQKLLAQCQRFCEEKQTILVLKGAPTWIFAPFNQPFLIAHGDPGMATAGSGDVLTGLIAALLAQGTRAIDAALLGVMLHGLAGEAAAKSKSSHCMIASDLIDFLPEAFKMNHCDSFDTNR